MRHPTQILSSQMYYILPVPPPLASLTSTQLLLTPLTMISFLISLSLVDRQQRQWRLSQHSSAESASPWFHFTSPEPYQHSNDGTWKHSSNVPSQNVEANTFRGWYRQKKHRAMAKMEINDALEMRRRVLFAFVAWALLGLFALTYATRRMYGWISQH